MTNRVTPTWGKTIGILMIILGALGVFFQFYKIAVPAIFRQSKMIMDNMTEIPDLPNREQMEMTRHMFDQMTEFSSFQSTVLVVSGILGLVACVVYIISGAKLLQAKPFNYHFAKTMLFVFLGINLLTIVLPLSDQFSIFVMGILVYVIIGFLFDLVLLIILLASNKRQYGVGVDPDDQSYSLDPGDPEIL